jgi:hypothetical protein
MKCPIIRQFTFASVLLLSVSAFAAGPIQDPVADYLTMQVSDRSEYVGALEFIRSVKIDVDGDGTDEVFVGTWYRYMGSDVAYYWSAYKAAQGGGYSRLTPNNADVFLLFGNIFAGLVQEHSIQGLVQCYGTQETTADSGELARISLYFYFIENGELKEEYRGELDMNNSVDKAVYDRYFGDDRQTRRPSNVDTFTTQQLQQMGYTVPNWEPPVP